MFLFLEPTQKQRPASGPLMQVVYILRVCGECGGFVESVEKEGAQALCYICLGTLSGLVVSW